MPIHISSQLCSSEKLININLVICRSLLSAILLVAAGAKMSSGGEGVLNIVISFFEATLALLLMVRRFQAVAKYLAIAFLFGSVCWSLRTLISNAPSCGCFGSHHVNPWHLLMFSVTGMAAIVLASSTKDSIVFHNLLLSRRGLLASTGLLAMASLLVGIDIVYGVENRSLSPISPYEEWIGKPMPVKCLGGFESQFGTGEWTVVFLRSGCSHCDLVARKLQQNALDSRHVLSARRLAFLYLNEPNHEDSAPSGPWVFGFLVGEKFANLPTPTIVWVSDNLVERVDNP